MHFITLDSETDFDGWRQTARALVLNDVNPSGAIWTVRGHEPQSFEPPVNVPLEVPHGTFNVPAKFVELARAAILHRDPERFALLYRLLWRLVGDHDPPAGPTAPDAPQIAPTARAPHPHPHRMPASAPLPEPRPQPTSPFAPPLQPAP